ncbi:MAG: tetratricopeptide repeat protein [Fidelibacterota bacterium]
MRILIFILTFISCLPAQHPGDKIVKKGVEAFYNYDYKNSVKILTQARRDFPRNPVVHLTWAAARWRKNEAYLTQSEIYENFNQDLDSVISVYNDLLIEKPEDPEYLLYLGATTGLKARILLGQKEWFSTLMAAYQGFRLIQQAFELDPSLKDAYLPIGIMEYYSGLSNFMVKFAAEIFGLHPSREIGIRKMEIAARESEWAWSEAESILSFIYLWADIDLERGLAVSSDLAEQYPRNYDFQIHYAESLLQNGQLKPAYKKLKELNERLPELTEQQQRWYTSYLNYEWGHYFFLTGELDRAQNYLKLCIENYNAELDAILAFAWLRSGMIYDLKGQREEAIKAYKNCIELDNFSKAIQLAETYLEQPYNG